MPEVTHLIVATAGHVDHGKSALVKALTGTDPDRLPEEKSRGITIDLGFANLELASPRSPDSKFVLGIVDVPGHEDFVKNMVAGVGSIDLALLVVAADDSWMPQTEEHLQILTYLGIKKALVALTKIDLARAEESIAAAIQAKLTGTPFEGAPIIPTAVISGRGVEELKAALADMAARIPPARDIGKPRLPVDRVFQLQGIGTVVTGTLTGGTLRRGQSVIVQPSGIAARIRSIQSHNREVEFAGPGTRTALNLPNLTAGEDLKRGDVITMPAYAGANKTLDVLLEISPRSNRIVKQGARVWLHHGSAGTPGHVQFFSETQLAPGNAGLAQLRLEAPILAFAGDRFVVRDWSEQNTLAGGVVLDPAASTASFRSEKRLRYLQRRAESPEDVQSYILSQLNRDRVVQLSKTLLNSRFSEQEIAAAIAALVVESKAVTLAKDHVVESETWTALRRRAMDEIDTFHRAHPEQMGMLVRDLRTSMEPELPIGALFDALMEDLCAVDFRQAGTIIRRRGHRPSLPPNLQAAGAKVRAALAAKPFDPPSRNVLAPDALSRQVLRYLLETGEAVEISADLVLAAESESRAIELIREFIRKHGPATVSELRQALGSSRRVVVPLLERLDRLGITTRHEDRRALTP
jgi:selenocysteine-specific elongation factor